MADHTDLEDTVRQYTQREFRKRTLSIAGALLSLCAVLLAWYGVTYLRLQKAEAAGKRMKQEHAHTTKQWTTFQQKAKRVRALKKELAYLNEPQHYAYMLILSKALPQGTVLHTFGSLKPGKFILTGYAQHQGEVTQFMHELSRNTAQELKLTVQQPLESGVLFTLEGRHVLL